MSKLIKDMLKKLFPERATEIDGYSEENEPKTGENNNYVNEDIVLLKQQNNELVKQIGELTKLVEGEKSTRETALKRMHDEKIEKLLNESVLNGKITPEKKELWKKRLENDYENNKEIIEELPINKSVTEKTEKQKTQNWENKPTETTTEIDRTAVENAYKESMNI